MTETEEQTTIEELARECDEAKEKLRQAKVLETQREVLAPRLEVARQKVLEKLEPLNTRLALLDCAIDDIDAGKITSFRLRKPRAKKQQAAPVAGKE